MVKQIENRIFCKPKKNINYYYNCGLALNSKTFSNSFAIDNNLSSLPTGASSSIPIGKPELETEMGKLIPGIPALLEGSVLRIKVGKVGCYTPFNSTVSSCPIGLAVRGEVGKIIASTL